MNGLETVSETEIFESLEFEPDTPCESAVHPDGGAGHIPEQKASMYVLRGCCGVVNALCQGAVNGLRKAQRGDPDAPYQYLWCTVCNTEWVDPKLWAILGPVGKL